MEIPLFSTIDIETTDFCNRKCNFCPKYKDEREEINFLPIETIDSIVEQLKELKYKRGLSFTNYGEPMFDKRLVEIISKFKVLGTSKMYLHTNGDYIKTSEDVIKILDAGITGLQINIYSENRREFTNKIIEETKELYGKDKFVVDNLYDYKSGIINLYLIDRTKFEDLKFHNKMINRAGNIPWIKKAVHVNKVCANPFRKFTIRATGDVSLCCEDYWNKIIFGNVKTDKIIDIWQSDKFKDIREKLIIGRRDLIPELCAKCDHTTYRNYKTMNYWSKFIDVNKYKKEENKRKSLFDL